MYLIFAHFRRGVSARTMLEQFLIFHRGGFVLFQLHPGAVLEGDPVGRLVAEQLVEERAAAADFTVGPYSLKWRLDNQRDVVYVVRPSLFFASWLSLLRS